jgi:hypothetical protein
MNPRVRLNAAGHSVGYAVSYLERTMGWIRRAVDQNVVILLINDLMMSCLASPSRCCHEL